MIIIIIIIFIIIAVVVIIMLLIITVVLAIRQTDGLTDTDTLWQTDRQPDGREPYLCVGWPLELSSSWWGLRMMRLRHPSVVCTAAAPASDAGRERRQQRRLPWQRESVQSSRTAPEPSCEGRAQLGGWPPQGPVERKWVDPWKKGRRTKERSGMTRKKAASLDGNRRNYNIIIIIQISICS